MQRWHEPREPYALPHDYRHDLEAYETSWP